MHLISWHTKLLSLWESALNAWVRWDLLVAEEDVHLRKVRRRGVDPSKRRDDRPARDGKAEGALLGDAVGGDLLHGRADLVRIVAIKDAHLWRTWMVSGEVRIGSSAILFDLSSSAINAIVGGAPP